MGYECAFSFFCANAEAARLQAGLGSLMIAEAGQRHATLRDGAVVAFKTEWHAAQAAPGVYALVPLSDRNIREDWSCLFEDGTNEHGSPAFEYAPAWHRGPPFEWFGVRASCAAMADREHTVFTVRPYFKDLANIMSQDIVRRFYRQVAFANGALVGLFVDDYSDILFSADVLVARRMHGSPFDESAPEQIEPFVGRALRALEGARGW